MASGNKRTFGFCAVRQTRSGILIAPNTHHHFSVFLRTTAEASFCWNSSPKLFSAPQAQLPRLAFPKRRISSISTASISSARLSRLSALVISKMLRNRSLNSRRSRSRSINCSSSDVSFAGAGCLSFNHAHQGNNLQPARALRCFMHLEHVLTFGKVETDGDCLLHTDPVSWLEIAERARFLQSHLLAALCD